MARDAGLLNTCAFFFLAEPTEIYHRQKYTSANTVQNSVTELYFFFCNTFVRICRDILFRQSKLDYG